MKSTFAILGLLSLAGCASIVDGSTQVISVQTRRGIDTVSGAACQLTNNKGTWFVTTPGTVAMHRSYDDLNVKCEKPDSEPGVATVPSSTKGMAFGNLVFGGIIGTAIDMGSGAAYDYPSLITVMMGAEKATAPAVAPVPPTTPTEASTATFTQVRVMPSCASLPPGHRVGCTVP